MRVLHVTRDYPPRCVGGISTAVKGMVDASRETGIECAVLSFDGWLAPGGPAPAVPLTAEDQGLDVPLMRISSPAQLTGVFGFAKNFSPDAIHVHDGVLWEFAEGAGIKLDAPVVITLHHLHTGSDGAGDAGSRTSALRGERKALERAQRVLVASEAISEHVLAQDDRPENLAARLRVVGLGVSDSAAARFATTERNERPGDYVLYVGKFGAAKGTDALFAAIPRILEKCPETQFRIVGGVPENKDAEARWLARWEREASEDVRAHVEFTGWLEGEALSEAYEHASVQLMPSRFETFGQAAAEAMLHGVPVVATRCGGVEDLLEHGRTGLLSPADDIDDLVNNAVRLLQRPDYALRMGEAGAQSVRNGHLWEQVLPALAATYEEVARH